MNARSLLPTLSATLLIAACSNLGLGGPITAEAPLAPTKGNAAAGTVKFTEVDGGVLIDASVTGLSPGKHGFHIHEKGDCSAPDGTSAGGHFNPSGKPHGDPAKGERHLGDMPMLVADANGNAKLGTILEGLTISGKGNIVGLGVIVHAAPDDFKTQPTGNSGARVACGVIARPK
ncbi:superoxide dismutase family protein [Aromatoleum petrolei]|uniref:Superoxide dismutase [Cu-Zn] n=1 Tax=Aromatoleum petrolei TaxID=76116 RepID=A0ABX1MMK3_9RHOO|nr:superoxide dismutase family protein [Aromatoleum petrolei]NMF89177.1 superoxide dismutase family protein [Aromatoleum petrolei]QTQ36505.1 Superoxide dismutase (Cu-Zn) [Aromatoleum petrolei]